MPTKKNSNFSKSPHPSEHYRDYLKQTQDSHIFKHLEVAHPGKSEPNFEFRVKGKFKSALVRQVTEAVLIRRAGESVLNSKGVYNRCYLPRLVVELNKNDQSLEKEKAGEKCLEWGESRWKRQKAEPTRRPGKRIKMDPTRKDNPRCEGISKRRAVENQEEFQQECKRLRPEFDPGEEADRMFSYATKNSTTDKNPIIFFSLFSKSNKSLNNEIMFRSSNNKPKLTSSKPKPKPKKKVKDLQPGISNLDIRKIFTQESSNSLEEGTNGRVKLSLHSQNSTKASQATILQTDVPRTEQKPTKDDIRKCSKEDNWTGLRPIIQKIKEDRARESEVMTRERCIKPGRSIQLMSTSSVAVDKSSDQAQFYMSEIDFDK